MCGRVIVIGAGIAGLTAAWRLTRAGLDVLVLEREAYAGGRIRTIPLGDMPWDCGAQFIGEMYQNTLALLKESGLKGQLKPINMGVDVIAGEGQYPLCRTLLGRARPCLSALPWRQRRALPGLALSILKNRTRLDLADLVRGRDLDLISLMDWAAGHGCPEMTVRYLDPVCRALFFQSSGEISLLIALTLLKHPHRMRFYTTDRGLAPLAEALAGKLRVVLNTAAVKVAPARLGGTINVETVCAGGIKKTLTAARVVLAVPPDQVLGILAGSFDLLDPAARVFLQTARFVGVGVTGLALTQTPANDLYGYVFQHSGSGLSSASFTAPPGSAGRTRATIISSPVSPGSSPEPDLLKAAGVHWPRLAEAVLAREDRFWPGALPLFPPGRIRELGQFMEPGRTSPLLAFCGDYCGGPGIEGAVSSGIRAAKKIMAAL